MGSFRESIDLALVHHAAARARACLCQARPSTLVLFRANLALIPRNQPSCASVSRSSPSRRVRVSSASMKTGAISGEFCVHSVRPSILAVCTKRHYCLHPGRMHQDTLLSASWRCARSGTVVWILAVCTKRHCCLDPGGMHEDTLLSVVCRLRTYSTKARARGCLCRACR